MAHIVADRVQETTTTSGTGTLTLLGAVTGYKTFSSRMATSDTCWYSVVDPANGNWEIGLGTLASSTTLARTTVLRSSNSDAAVSLQAAATKTVFIAAIADKDVTLDNQGAIVLPAIANPTAPAADTLSLFARKISGRMMPKWMPPSGVDNPVQPALFGNRIQMYVPSLGTTGTGSGTGLGSAWIAAGTVNHPTSVSTAPAISNQMKRTRYANVVTTTNQELGIKFTNSEARQFWRGNAAGLGGFFYQARFIVELYPASTVRLFAGMSGTLTSVAISDTVLVNSCGLWHDTTDPSTGAGAFNFVTKDATTATKQQITLSNAIAAGNSYDFYMYAKPNDTIIYWRLDDIVNNVTYENNTATTLPVNTVFMAPQIAMSNGTANITVTTTAIGVAGVYVESDR